MDRFKSFAIIASVLLGSQVSAQGEGLLPLPSGRAVHLQEILSNQLGNDGLTSHFRFIAEGMDPQEDWSEDMLYLCETYALSMVAGQVPQPRQIVISLADQTLPFGEAAPDAVQLFEAYYPDENHCIWEMF